MRNFKSILKRLKKIWRKKRNWAVIMFATMVLSTVCAVVFPFHPEGLEALGNKQIQIVLEKEYVCGENTVEYHYSNDSNLEAIQEQYKDWQYTSFDGTTANFSKKVWDLSPECKENGYFGLSEDGQLTLFKGPPENKEVIETFFQIDVEKLRSGLSTEPVFQLYEGIKVKDMSDYNSILSLFSSFSTE